VVVRYRRELAAFHNSCRHALANCSAVHGKRPRLVWGGGGGGGGGGGCPYHQLTYQLDGPADCGRDIGSEISTYQHA